MGEEGNGKPPHKIHFPRRSSEPCLWFLLRSKSSMQRSRSAWRLSHHIWNIPCNESVVILLTKELPLEGVLCPWFELRMSTDFVGAAEEELSPDVPQDVDWSPIKDASFEEFDDGCVARIMIFCADEVLRVRAPDVREVMTDVFGTSVPSFAAGEASHFTAPSCDASDISTSAGFALVTLCFLLRKMCTG